ncbi:MAG: DNA mismatch repair endonuclease MutL [Deltaproteobacteria bacterium]|nr:DNA mismatch repair endonuclease MutL [Deltaproteobacteria bacterium]
MNTIRVLPEDVSTQIAAGEVIERPASVVKELLDNCIDAGSDRILIEIAKGGKRLIKVRDNGVGMNRDDLLLCLERHATSKIKSASDLFCIDTFGFRGEALPSMASVSRMEITSRPKDQLAGYKVKIDGGKLKSIDETGSPAGTIVEVRDLFFNTPVRKRFLRAEKTETDHIIDVISKIALPFLHIDFRLDDGEKTLLSLPISENDLNRLAILMGRNVAGSMEYLDQRLNALKIKAYLASPDLSRSRGDRIFVYVNHRSVRDRLITRAVIEGYGQHLMKRRYPQVAVFIEMPPSMVDINVHPTKQEIRFRDGLRVYQSIVSAIEGVLGEKYHRIPNIALNRGATEFGEIRKAQIHERRVAEPEGVYSGSGDKGSGYSEDLFQEQHLVRQSPQIIGQLRDTYILCQSHEGLLLVDQHAAHERIVYESLKKAYQNMKIEGQAFLIPHRLEFSLKEGRIIEEKTHQLSRLGVELEHFGGCTFLLRSVPTILVNAEWEGFLLDLVPVLEEEEDLSNDKAMDRFLTVMACHGAIRAGKRLSQQEMISLISQLQKMDLPTNCPHGRPIFRQFSYYEIEKMFKRVA